MPEREISISVVLRSFDEGVLSAEPLLFHEIHCCGRKSARVRATVRELAKKIADRTPMFALHRRELPSHPVVEQVEVTLEPPKRRLEWTEPLKLQFDIVRWRHGNDAHLVFVPALNIEIVVAKEPELKRVIPEQIIAHLRRTKIAESLYELALTQRIETVEIEPLSLTFHVKKPKAAEQEEQKETDKKPVIEEVGLVLDSSALRPAYEVQPVVQQLADALVGRNPRSVLMIGASGVGKTAIVHELVRQRQSLNLGATPFWATSGSRLIAGMSGFGMWQQRCQRLCKEVARDRAILHVGNLVELMEVGRGGAGGQGIAGFLRPYLGRGEILVIAECTPEQLPLIERENPHLLEVFVQLKVEEPGPTSARKILACCARPAGVPTSGIADGRLDALDRLHRRYATYSAYPGRPVRFLENFLKDLPEGRRPEGRDIIASFSRETGLPLFMLDPDVPLDLVAAREWFAGRVIGQERAVDLVIDLLATVKAALTRPRRPIASLLFIGPTGVGKTEMAKALAEYFFGDRNRLTRFDMSEFADPAALERLIGGTFGAEGMLTAKIREQPFSVVLFDEFEKAGHGFFDLLLQVLGEGRLTDAAGRLGDFSNAIVVMTSNLGAETFGRGTFGLTRGDGYPDPSRHFTEEVRSFLRPELFNRIDRIVPFLPLDSATLERIALRELQLVEQRDGLRLRAVGVEVSNDALRHLIEKGYDIRYGARPLKRAIERELLAPLSDRINHYSPDVQLRASAQMADDRLEVSVSAKAASGGTAATMLPSRSPLAELAGACAGFRRDVQNLGRSSALLAVRNQRFFLERSERRRAAKQRPTYDAERAERIKQLQAIVGPCEMLIDSIKTLEDEVLVALYGNEPVDRPALADQLEPLRKLFDDLLLALLARETSKPHMVTVAIFGHEDHRWALARAYESIARSTGCQVDLVWFSRYGSNQLRRHAVVKSDEFFAQLDAKAIGIAMTFKGTYAALRFGPEKGLHVFERNKEMRLCDVNTSDVACGKYVPPAGVESLHAWAPGGSGRRRYDLPNRTAKDAVLQQELSWSGHDIQAVIADAMEAQLRQAARAVIDQ